MSLLINIAAQFSGKKALKDAQKQVNVLESSVKKLGTTLGVSLSAAAVVAFGKASVKAFAEDEKAASRLAGVLDNLGLSFANLQVAGFIEDLSKASGVVDDDLRPAFQALITTTGSLTNSQKLLAQAVDVSAGSGENLTTVANDLAQAYVGNTRGLRKYNLGLTQAELKAASFADIQKRLTELFSGANAKYLTTYAGKMQVLTTAAGEAQEIIGGALLDSLVALGGDTSVEDLADSMNDLATYTGNVIRGLGNLAKKFDSLPKVGGANILAQLLTVGQAGKIKRVLDLLEQSGGRKQSTGFSFFGSPMEQTQKARDAAAAAKAEKLARDRARALLKAEQDRLKELRKQALAKKQSALFDMEQIQIIAALKGNISKEERLRLELQLALITGNTTEADKLSQKLANSIDQTGNLAKYLTTLPDANNPFKNWEAFLDAMIQKAREAAAAAGAIGGGGGVPSGNVPNTNPFPDPSASQPEIDRERGNFYGSGNVGAQNVVVQIDGRAVASALLDQSMSAGQVAYLDRRTGGF